MVNLGLSRLDCRHFKGNLPCKLNSACPGCRKYQPQGKKVLIIKLSAVGDVLRTTPLLRGLKRKYPNSHITWLTLKESLDLLKGNNFIDRLLGYDFGALERLRFEQFDLLISLDKEDEATALASLTCAKNKIGFGLDRKTGNVIPLNKESQYAFALGLSDELKFKQNKKSYPEIIFEMCGLKYKNDEYILNISDSDRKYAQGLLSKMQVPAGSLIIGLNTGAGDRFVHKAWGEDSFVELIRLIQTNLKTRVFLLGGPQEVARNRSIASNVGRLVFDIGCQHTLGQFCAIVESCSLVVTGDTTALHIALALKKPVVAIFGSTCEQEIELYGRGVKIASDIECRPCYKKECDRQITCMDLIKPQEVFQAAQKLLPQ